MSHHGSSWPTRAGVAISALHRLRRDWSGGHKVRMRIWIAHLHLRRALHHGRRSRHVTLRCHHHRWSHLAMLLWHVLRILEAHSRSHLRSARSHEAWHDRLRVLHVRWRVHHVGRESHGNLAGSRRGVRLRRVGVHHPRAIITVIEWHVWTMTRVTTLQRYRWHVRRLSRSCILCALLQVEWKLVLVWHLLRDHRGSVGGSHHTRDWWAFKLFLPRSLVLLSNLNGLPRYGKVVRRSQAIFLPNTLVRRLRRLVRLHMAEDVALLHVNGPNLAEPWRLTNGCRNSLVNVVES